MKVNKKLKLERPFAASSFNKLPLLLLATALFSSTSLLQAYEIPKAGPPPLSGDDISELSRLSKSISKISEHAKKGIVFVSVSKTVHGMPLGQGNPFEFFFGPGFPPGSQGRPGPIPDQKQEGVGSGFFIDLEKPYILTNNHVVDGADEIHVKTATGETYEAVVVGRDKNTDIAVVEIKDKSFNRKGLVALGLMDNSDEATVGELCLALGAPFGLEASVSLGVISALGRGNLQITDLGNFIQTDAAINPGNSGGPLINVSGQVMGINTAIFSKSGGYNGIGFAIPASLVRGIATQIINDGKVKRGYLGVQLAPLEPEFTQELGLPKGTKGVLIQSVLAGGPAAAAGLKVGDLVVSVDGKLTPEPQELRNAVGLKSPGTKVALQILRDGKSREITLSLGDFKSAETLLAAEEAEEQNIGKIGEFGLDVSDLTSTLKRKFKVESKEGALITQIAPNTPAAQVGLLPGDVIVKVNRTRIPNAKRFWQEVKKKDRVLLTIERQGNLQIVPLGRR